MKGAWGVLVKDAEMTRGVWVSPGGTTRLRIRASSWSTRAGAEAWVDQLKADPRNGHLIVRVVEFT